MYRILRTDPVTVVQIFEREGREGLEEGAERRGREGHAEDAEDAEKRKRVGCPYSRRSRAVRWITVGVECPASLTQR